MQVIWSTCNCSGCPPGNEASARLDTLASTPARRPVGISARRARVAGAWRPDPDNGNHPWIIDGTLIPVHDQSITAISKNSRRSVNTQIIIICSYRRRVVVAGQCWPGNRDDVIVARHTVAHLLDGRVVLGDGGYRGIRSITTPRRDQTGHIIRDHHYQTHRRIRARVEHVIARLKDWQILRQCRRRGDAINHSLQIVAGLWNLKIRNQLRVNS